MTAAAASPTPTTAVAGQISAIRGESPTLNLRHRARASYVAEATTVEALDSSTLVVVQRSRTGRAHSAHSSHDRHGMLVGAGSISSTIRGYTASGTTRRRTQGVPRGLVGGFHDGGGESDDVFLRQAPRVSRIHSLGGLASHHSQIEEHHLPRSNQLTEETEQSDDMI